MTELIIALDGESSLEQAYYFYDEGQVWFKIGPQMVLNFRQWRLSLPRKIRIFLDLKLADTADTVREAVKRFVDLDIAAVSTYTQTANEVAAEVSAGTNLKVWHVVALTDTVIPTKLPIFTGDGVICPGYLARQYKDYDTVVPGVRFKEDAPDGHKATTPPNVCVAMSVTYAVVGRPIWKSADPNAAYHRYRRALEGV